MIFELSECEAIIGYKFRDIELFRQCFTHASYTNEHPGEKNNERLEFFGDKILDFVLTLIRTKTKVSLPKEERILFPRNRLPK